MSAIWPEIGAKGRNRQGVGRYDPIEAAAEAIYVSVNHRYRDNTRSKMVK
jgi:hypothetical protein